MCGKSRHLPFRVGLKIVLFLGAVALQGAGRMIAQEPAEPHGAPATQQNTVSYLYGPWYKAPYVENAQGKGAGIARNILEWTHLDQQAWGGNMLDLYLRHSSGIEPAVGGGTGATEAYLIERSDLSLRNPGWGNRGENKVFRDLFVRGGANLSTKNSSYSPEERSIYFGPGAQFRIPRGMVSLALMYRKEWNHEGILGRAEEYDSDATLESVWFLPLRVACRPLAWKGFLEVNSPKGMSTLGIQTKTETLLRTQVLSDPGQLLNRKPWGVELGIGLEYWHNFAGMPAKTVPGAEELTPYAGVTIHLPGRHS